MSLECPEETAEFNLIETDGFHVYVKNNLTAENDTFTLKYKRGMLAGGFVTEGLLV